MSDDIVAVEYDERWRRMTLRFHCDRCDEEIEYLFTTGMRSAWPEWRELASRSARSHHAEICPPRRGLYREALVAPLRLK